MRDAIAAGIIPAEATLCGVSRNELRRLEREGYGNALVLVRYRTAYSDSRQRLTVSETLRLPHDRWAEVRDVYPIVNDHASLKQ
jgi:hypothetical protein